MSAPEDYPKRCYNITLSAGGDSWPAAMRQLRDLVDEVKHDPECGFVVGGYDSDGYVKVEHDPSMTHARYIAALKDRNRE